MYNNNLQLQTATCKLNLRRRIYINPKFGV